MRKILFTLTILFVSLSAFSQTNKEIAGVYIRKAEKNYADLKVDEAAKNYDKALKLLDTITRANVARLGTVIYFKLNKFEKAKGYAKQYFALVKKKNTTSYTELLDLYVTIEEELEKIEKEKKRLEKIRLAKEKETRRIDSLKTAWQNKADALTLQFNAVQAFNKQGIAVFQKDDFFGVMNDAGKILVAADTYKDVKSFDGYILLLNEKENPTQIYSFDSKTKEGFALPSVAEFNTLSTHYGKVMLPRGDGKIITYPNNSLKALVFDVTTKEFDKTSYTNVIKELKKTKKIEKSNKEGQVRINKSWYDFGGHIGGGIHPLYLSDYTLYGFLCAIDGTVLKATEFNNLGAFYNGKANVITDGESFWVNQNGTKVDNATNEAGKYTGKSKLTRLEAGGYQIHQEIDGETYIVLGDEKLETLESFIRKNP